MRHLPGEYGPGTTKAKTRRLTELLPHFRDFRTALCYLCVARPGGCKAITSGKVARRSLMSPSSPRGNLLPSVHPDSITVILSSHDSGRHLNKALAAVLTQTRAAAQIVVVDDMSTDDSIEVIERARANSGIVELIRNPYRLGVLSSLNLALGRATSSLVAMLTAEDVPSPDSLMHSATVLETFPTAAFCCAKVEIIDEDSSVISVRPLLNPPHGGHYFAPHQVRELLHRGDNFFSGAFSLFRRSKLEEIGGFDSTLGCLADSVLQRRMAVRWGFCFIHRVLAARRITGSECAEQIRTNPGNLDQMLLRAHRIIEGEPHGLFPRNYPQVLVRRLRFEAGQLIAAKSRTDRNAAQLVARIIKARKLETCLLAWLGRTGRAAPVLTSAWLFLKLRPFSLYWALQATYSRLFVRRGRSPR